MPTQVYIGAGSCGSRQALQLFETQKAMNAADDILVINILTNVLDVAVEDDSQVLNVVIGTEGTGGNQGEGEKMWNENKDAFLTALKQALTPAEFKTAKFVLFSSLTGGSGSVVGPAANLIIGDLGGVVYNVVSAPVNERPTDKEKTNTGLAFKNYINASAKLGRVIPMSYVGAPGVSIEEANKQAFVHAMSMVTLYREIELKNIVGVDNNDVKTTLVGSAVENAEGLRSIFFTTEPVNEALEGCVTGIGMTSAATYPAMSHELAAYKPARFTAKNNQLLLLHGGESLSLVMGGNDDAIVDIALDYITLAETSERSAKINNASGPQAAKRKKLSAFGNKAAAW